MRNAESLFNEARLISYAIYNIAAVNITMIAIQYVVNTIYIIIYETRVPRTKRYVSYQMTYCPQSLHISPCRAGYQISVGLLADSALNVCYGLPRIRP